MTPQKVSHFIGGQPVQSALGKLFGVAAPATGEEYAQVAVGVAGDVNQAVLAARAALDKGPWPEMAAQERAGVLRGIASAIGARAADIAAAEALGAGLPLTQAREQAGQAADLFRLAADLVTARAAAGTDPSRSVLTRPAGVAGLVTSRPFLALARALAPALAAGCTVVLKPDERAPLPAALLAEITAAAGLPGGVLNIVHGSLHPRAPGAQARDALIAHPDVARLSLDMDADAGADADARQQVMLDAATRQKRLYAVPAGSAPCLIFADADLDQATDGALFGAFALCGQRRTATSTILVEFPVYDELVSRLAQRADRIRVGDPADPATELGALPGAGQYERLVAGVRLGVREGARLTAGGRRPAGWQQGSFLAATVLSDVTPSMRVFTEPLRGPVARVTPFATEEEALSLAALRTPLTAAYIWTADGQRAGRLASALESPSTWVNSSNPLDQLTGALDEPGLDFYATSRSVFTAASDTPVPRFGALSRDPR